MKSIFKLLDILETKFRLNCHRLHDRTIDIWLDFHAKFKRRFECIFMFTFGGFHRLDPGQHLIQDRTYRIDVCIKSLIALVTVLLRCRITNLDDFFTIFSFGAVIQLCRTKVKDFDRIFAGNKNVIRADVPMNDSLTMYFLNRIDDKVNNMQCYLRFHFSLFFEIIF